jgi:hypothetical protein
MTDVDGREASSYSVTCPDCGCITARTGLKKHRGSRGCRGRRASNDAAARGLVCIHKNAQGMLDDVGLTYEVIETDQPGSGTVKPRLWVDRVTAGVYAATVKWSRAYRVVALAMTKYTMTPAFHTALAYFAEIADYVGIQTLLGANGNFPEPEPKLRLAA